MINGWQRWCLGLGVLVASQAFAQQTRPPAGRPDTTKRTAAPNTRARRDTVGLRADSTTLRELVKWAETDSVMAALLKREGYTVTRYQGRTVLFDAQTNTLYIVGAPAAVSRDRAVLVGDSIVYNDSTEMVYVYGDTVILRDPAQNADDLVARGSLAYNVATRRGSVTNIATTVATTDKWLVQGETAGFLGDTSKAGRTTFFARNAILTSCDDTLPDYYFKVKEIKVVYKRLMVGRPAVLYVAGVPVMWLPFIFDDLRSGRRSGFLRPTVGISEVFRASPSYRRHVDNVGYYLAMNDYMDGQLWLDWRSGARSELGDPGWMRWNGQWQYRWLNRFLTGRVAASHLSQRDGQRNTSLSWAHQQDFSQTSRLSANVNYVTSTVIQRRNAFDPAQVLATIGSQVAYQNQFGPFALALGGQRTQYPGRGQIDQDLPTVSLTTQPIALASWFDWTPSLSMTNRQSLNIDQLGEISFRYTTRPDGQIDSVRLRRDARTSDLSFNTPIRIGGLVLQNSIRMFDIENDFPESRVIVDPLDPTKRSTRIFAKTFRTEVDWNTGINLPSLLRGTLNLSPSVSIVNVDPSGYMVRSEQTGGKYVRQSKRLTYGLSMSPTLFGLFPGIGSVTRFRHSINPVISFDYAPEASVSDEFLRALNRSRADYLGALAQNRVTLRFSHNLEAKLRSTDTSAAEEDRKVRVLSMAFSPLTWDFERRRATGHTGLVTDAFGYDVASDLLPGFSLRVGYSLFEGNVLSDTARYKPYRTNIDASMALNGESGIFAAINRLLGRAVPQQDPQIEKVQPTEDEALIERAATAILPRSPVTRRGEFGVPPVDGWKATLTFSSTRQRPPVGGGSIIQYDPATLCEPYRVNPLEYSQCLFVQASLPSAAVPFTSSTAGAPFVLIPPRETLNGETTFKITQKWSASWRTMYDFEVGDFASHTVTLQRDLHDWNAVFGFTQAPNGNFSFNFTISLKANPDVRLPYDKQTYRRQTF